MRLLSFKTETLFWLLFSKTIILQVRSLMRRDLVIKTPSTERLWTLSVSSQSWLLFFFFFSSVLETENTCVFTNGFGFLFGGLPCWLSCKEPVCNAGDPGSIPGSGRSPREGNATHSSIPAWRIPWTEEPGRLQSMGLQRVVRDQATLTISLFVHSFEIFALNNQNEMKIMNGY